MLLAPSFSFLTTAALVFLTSTTTAEPVEKGNVEALARTSASAISYGITQQGFAVLGQTHLFTATRHSRCDYLSFTETASVEIFVKFSDYIWENSSCAFTNVVKLRPSVCKIILIHVIYEVHNVIKYSV